MILNEREIKILEKFYNKSELSIYELAKEFNVSERMIRYNIDRINDVLSFIRISPIKKSSKGTIILNIEGKENKILEIIKKLEPLDKNKKITIIQWLILFSKEKITITYLTKYFDLSRGTIINYLNELKKRLKVKGIKIENDNGLYLKGDRENLENYRFNILFDDIKYIYKEDDNEISVKLNEIIFQNIDKNTFKSIKQFIDEIISDFKLSVNDINYRILFTRFLIIFIEKSKSTKEYVIKESDKKYVLNKLRLLNLTSKVTEQMLEQIIDLVAWIKQSDNYQEKDVNIGVVVKSIISQVEAKINKNITKDKLLFEFLLQHVNALISRIDNGYMLDAQTLDESYKKKDAFFYIIKDSMGLLNNVLNKKIDDDEIHLLKIHFLASIERINRLELKPVEVAVITSFGSGSNKILVDNIQNRFYIKVSYVGSIYNFNKALKNNLNIKYILTTVKLDEKEYEDKIIVNISPVITEKERQTLLKLGFKSNINKILLSNIVDIVRRSSEKLDYEKFISELLNNFGDKIVNDIEILDEYENILKEENIIFNYDAKDIYDALEKGCSLLEGEFTDKSYTKDILSIYEKNNSHIIRYNGLILPHTKNNNNVHKTGVSIISLKEPVNIKETGEMIDTVVSFSIKDEKKSLDIISNLINMVFKSEFKEILNEKNKYKIVEYLKNYKL
ncbi:PTS sugar transporter subunit IIA [uncultured Sneathia sp.]|uniref:BglG family transcription antiterminator n=1 Tax=uncultured Sneathia sp. TaxID=278067 RepID=UPI00259493C1|nr:PTS sugar transporter subunit IIA [uncultured Sneathia sp.]